MNRIKERLNRVPVLTAIAVFFILGILSASRLNIPFLVWWILALALLLAAFSRRRKNYQFSIVFLSAVFFLGAAHSANQRGLPANHIGLFKPGYVRAKGEICSDPVYRQRGQSFVLAVNSISRFEGDGFLSVRGRVLVNLFQPQKLYYGDELVLEGALHKPFNFSSGANFSYRDYLENQGIYRVLSVRKQGKVILLGPGKGFFLQGIAFKIKHRLKKIFRQYLWEQSSRVLSGIILGERQDIPAWINQAFICTGTAHIIAISGFNVGIVVFIVLFILKALRIRRALRFRLAIPILILHCLVVGSGPSVVRATVMAVVLLVGYLLERENSLVNSLSLAAIAILGYNSREVFDLGFQLSFVSVLGIGYLSGRIISWFKLKPKANVFLKLTLESLAVSLSAWLVTFGFIAYYFRIISPVTILANLIIVPLSSLVIILGFVLALSALVLPAAAVFVAAATDFALAILFKAAIFLSSIPFAYIYF